MSSHAVRPLVFCRAMRLVPSWFCNNLNIRLCTTPALVVTVQGIVEAIERKWLGRKSGKGFYIYEQQPGAGGRKSREGSGKRPANQEMVDLLRKYPPPGQPHVLAASSSSSRVMEDKVLQERMVLRFVKVGRRVSIL